MLFVTLDESRTEMQLEADTAGPYHSDQWSMSAGSAAAASSIAGAAGMVGRWSSGRSPVSGDRRPISCETPNRASC
jgi:hypothetical protein